MNGQGMGGGECAYEGEREGGSERWEEREGGREKDKNKRDKINRMRRGRNE